MTTVRTTMTLLLLALLALLAACTPTGPEPAGPGPTATSAAGVEKTIFVGPERVDCVGVAPQKCYQVSETAGGEWETFYGRIEGFDYDSGYLYELRVREEPVANLPADASSLRWTLLEVVSMEPVEVDRAPDAAVGIYKGIYLAASGPGIDSTLYLNDDQTVRLVDDYLDGALPVIETGQWTYDGHLGTITWDGSDRTVPLTFEMKDDGLILTSEDGAYGDEGRRYLRFEVLATEPEAVPYDSSLTRETANGLEGIYKGFAPAASCCGLDLTLTLGPDGEATLKSDYLNGEEPMVEQGSWTLDGDIVEVMLEGAESPMTFDLSESPLILSSREMTIFGESPLRMYRVEGIALPMSAVG